MRRLIPLSLLFLSTPSPARAGELDVGLGVSAEATSWGEEAAGYGSLYVGWRFGRWSVDFLGREGYAGIDDRVLSYFSLGGSVWGRLGKLRPHARVALVHQHEEPLPAVYDDPFGVLFGVGDGIRHRGGASIAAGLGIPLGRMGQFPVSLDLGVIATGFPDDRGPSWYFGGGASLRFTYKP